jgi:hypothetical protein
MAGIGDLDRVAERARAAARDGGLIETAQIKLLGLDAVRDAAGARWPHMREYVREGSTKIISSRLNEDDSVIPCGDGFLVVFADASPEATQRRCAELSDALIAFYLGEDALRAVRADVSRQAASAHALASMMTQTAPPPRRTPSEGRGGRFWPIWAVQRRAVAAHYCAPRIDAGGGTARLGYDTDFLDKQSHKCSDYLDLDLRLLDQADSAAKNAPTAPIGVSVHVTTMRNQRARRLYLDQIAAISLASQRMFIVIAEIEPGTPLVTLTEWVSTLRRTFPRVGLELHHSDRALNALGSAGIWAAGFHLSMPPWGTSTPLRAELNDLDGWCRTLRRQGVQPLIHGFAEQAFLDLASCSDLAFATGEKLWPSLERPLAASASRGL